MDEESGKNRAKKISSAVCVCVLGNMQLPVCACIFLCAYNTPTCAEYELCVFLCFFFLMHVCGAFRIFSSAIRRSLMLLFLVE